MRPTPSALNLTWATIFSLAFMQPAIPLLGYVAVPTDFLFIAVLLTWLLTLRSGRSAFAWDNAFWWLALYFAAGLASAVASGDPMRSAPALLKNLYLLSLPVLIVKFALAAISEPRSGGGSRAAQSSPWSARPASLCSWPIPAIHCSITPASTLEPFRQATIRGCG